MNELLSTRFWALEEEFFDRMHNIIMHRIDAGKDIDPFVQNLKDQNKSIEDHPQINALEIFRDDHSGLLAYRTDSDKRVARIPMVGAMTKNGGLCSLGSVQLARMIEAADASPNIDSILLFVDGPGGTVSGTRTLGSAIKNAEKPVISYVDELAASAHLWAISQSDYIVGNDNEYTIIGSLGVMSILTNEGEKLEKQGTKVLILRGHKSSDKNVLNHVEEWPAEAIQERQAILNEMNDDFISTVKEGRGARITSEEGFSGKVFPLDKAIEIGFADYKGSLIDSIELAADVARSRTKTVTN